MPNSVATTLTGLGETSLPRPRRLSSPVTTNATVSPEDTNERKGPTATSGVPKKIICLGRVIGKGASIATLSERVRARYFSGSSRAFGIR